MCATRVFCTFDLACDVYTGSISIKFAYALYIRMQVIEKTYDASLHTINSRVWGRVVEVEEVTVEGGGCRPCCGCGLSFRNVVT